MSNLLRDIIKKAPPDTELYRQALRKDQALTKSVDLKASDLRIAKLRTAVIDWLDTQWNGPQWLPDDIRLARATPNSPYEPPAALVADVKKVTSLVQAKSISLHSLQAQSGPLRNAVSCHMAGKDMRVTGSGQGYPMFGLSQERIDATVKSIGLPAPTERKSDNSTQVTIQKGPTQMSQTTAS
jgi:hypothetical protein